jgi:DNA-binding CsgD family transcriptional regulator/tetratricopeptide (TPR) repeat protein
MVGVPAPDGPLIGRDAELRALHTAFEGGVGGQPGVVVLSGEAGVGKSRLIAELVARAGERGVPVLTGSCVDAAEAHLPYLPFAQVLGQLRELEPDLVVQYPALAPLLPDAPLEGRPPETLGHLPLFDAVQRALARFGASPGVLVLEDLHWADRSSRGLLAFLLSRPLGRHLLVLASHRSDLPRQHPLRALLAELARYPVVDRLEVAPLDAASALTLVRSLVPPGTPEQLSRAVADRSEGNPFFAEELAAVPGTLPDALADVLLARVERLDPTTQQVLRLASVGGGRWVRHDRLAAVAGLPDATLDAAVREALGQRVLVARTDPDGYAFRHTLLGEALYADLVPGERSRAHAAFAAAAEGDTGPGTAAELAYHRSGAGDHAGALVAHVRAAREAQALGAPADVLWHADRALRLWPDVRPDGIDEIDVHDLAATAAAHTSDHAKAVRHAGEAVRLAEDAGNPVRMARARRAHVEALSMVTGGYQRAEQAAVAAVEGLDGVEGDDAAAERAWATAMAARTALNLGRFADAGERARSAIELEKPAHPAVIDAHITLSAVVDVAGDTDEAVRLLVEAEQHGVPRVALRATFNRGMLHYRRGALAEAVEAFRDAERRAAASSLSFASYGVESQATRRVVHAMTGEWAEALDGLDLDATVIPSAPQGRFVVAALPALVALGRFVDARRVLDAVHAAPVVEDQVALQAGTAGAELALWEGDPAESVAWAERTLAWLDSLHSEWNVNRIRPAALGLSAAAVLAEQARRRGDAAALDAALASARTFHGRSTDAVASVVRPLGPEGRAWARWADAELAAAKAGDDADAWLAVVEAFGYGEEYRQACARRRLATVLLAAGKRDAAADELRAALGTATRLGAAPLAAAVRAVAESGGLRMSGERAPVPDVITPRERSVLALVAGGRTNRQVGEELYISEKTVSVHLTRVMAKLGAANRTEAVRMAYERGLL